MPGLDLTCKSKIGKSKRLDGHNSLQKNNCFAFIPMFNENACWQGKQQSRQGGREADQAKIQGTTRESIGKVGQGSGLHPGANDGDQLTDKEQDEVTRSQSRQALV